MVLLGLVGQQQFTARGAWGSSAKSQEKWPAKRFRAVPVRYELLLNAKHTPVVQYVTLAHELAHLYCGHVGTPNDQWWPDRRGLPEDLRELEAESVAFLVCRRLGIDNPSERFVADYLGNHEALPTISLDAVVKAAGLIEQMGRERLKPRKETREGAQSATSPSA